MKIKMFVAGQLRGFARSINRNVFVGVSNIKKIFDDRAFKIAGNDDVIYRYQKLIRTERHKKQARIKKRYGPAF